VDLELAQVVNQAGLGWIDPVSELFCAVGFLVAFWLGVVAFVWWRDRPRRATVTAGVALAIAFHFVVSEMILKHAVLAFVPGRMRPWVAHPETIVPIGHRFDDSSFPSSHAASTAAIGLVIAWHYPRTRIPVVLFVIAMSLARVHNGMHYPTDVLAGTILGVLYGAIAIWVVARWRAAPKPAVAAAAPRQP
jgi:undecaprenyl-diphosphatase